MITKFKPYLQLMRFDKPIGIYLLLWPTLWGLCIASHGQPSMKHLIIFTLGTIIMRACGCIFNDIADRDFDKHVARTKARPLTAKLVTLREAIILFLILALLAFSLTLFLNVLVMKLAVIGILITMSYPFCKRFIHTPQCVLGVAFSMGIPMAFAAQTNTLSTMPWLLFIGAILWPIIYDTYYAMADREDDLKIGIKSTAILFGNYDRLIIGILQLIMFSLFILLGISQGFHFPYYIGLGIAVGLATYQQFITRKREANACFRAFLNNHLLGLSILLGIYFQYWVGQS